VCSSDLVQLPRTFENEHFRADIGREGYLTSLVEKRGGVELARGAAPPFGGLALQMDYGDLWLNFESPLSGGSLESALTQNHPDPYDRSKPGELVNRGTFPAQAAAARAVARGDEELEIEQEGDLSFWRLRVPFVTRVRLAKHSPRIEYETTLTPAGRHYRIRVAFPTAIRGGTIRHEIPFGIQVRGEHEHVARNWADYGDAEAGLALLNAGTPASNVDAGILLLTLFRAAAMEYKAPSADSFQEGVTHTFRYAVLPHPAGADVEIVRNGLAFNQPPVPCAVAPQRLKACEWRVDGAPNVVVSALRWSGDGVFVRAYECAGRSAEASLRVPARFTEFAPADGLERASGTYVACHGTISLKLRPFEIQGFLLRAAKR
jgi:alpha-mannosidase